MEQFVEGNKKKVQTWWADTKKKTIIKSTRRHNTYTHLFGLTKSAMEESTAE